MQVHNPDHTHVFISINSQGFLTSMCSSLLKTAHSCILASGLFSMHAHCWPSPSTSTETAVMCAMHPLGSRSSGGGASSGHTIIHQVVTQREPIVMMILLIKRMDSKSTLIASVTLLRVVHSVHTLHACDLWEKFCCHLSTFSIRSLAGSHKLCTLASQCEWTL